jgi:hypothetical protein
MPQSQTCNNQLETYQSKADANPQSPLAETNGEKPRTQQRIQQRINKAHPQLKVTQNPTYPLDETIAEKQLNNISYITTEKRFKPKKTRTTQLHTAIII